MKTKAFAIIVCLVLLPILTSVCFGDETEIRYRWTRSMGGIYNEVPRAKTIDSSGNIYVTGSFEGTVDFGFDFGTTDIKASAGKSDRDIFITKIMSDGTYGWTKHIGCNTYGYVFHEIATAIVTDSSDDVYITGGFGLTVDFGLDFGVTDIKTSGGNLDIFVTKINSDGTYGWTKCMGGQWSQWDDIGRCICADSSDNIYVAGYFFATVDFGLDFGTTDEKDGWGGGDIFITKINSNGTYGWTRRMGGNYYEDASAITTDSTGNIYITGAFGMTVDFGLDFGTTDTKTSAGAQDCFVTKINSDGTYGWTKCMGGEYWNPCSNDSGVAITTDSTGNVYIAGMFGSTVDFGLDFGTTDIKTPLGCDDIFITKINSDGTYGWTKRMGGEAGEGARRIFANSSDNIYILGYFNGTVDFGLDFGTTDAKTSAGYRTFATKINSDGTYGWTKCMEGILGDRAPDMIVDSSGNIFVGSGFEGTVDFGFDFGVTDIKTSAGWTDIFVTKLSLNHAPVANEQSITTNENTPQSITLNAFDEDGDPLTYMIVDPPGHGTLSGTGPNLTYTPDLNFYGPDSFTFKANDGIADSNSATVSITVEEVYAFSGFFSPVDNLPTVNVAKAGQVVPIKWLLTDQSGVSIANPASFGSVTSYSISCNTLSGDPAAEVEEYTPGSSGLQYLGDGYWQFNWKTPKAYKGQCRMMVLTLADGTMHYASFSFK